MSAERPYSIEQLRGKNVLEVISLLPTFPWVMEVGGRHLKPEIKSLVFVDYDAERPKEEIDLFGHLAVTPGEPIGVEAVSCFRSSEADRITGLTSLVELTEIPCPEMKMPWAHIPMLDIDLHSPGDLLSEVLPWIKKEMKEKLIEPIRGVILSSGRSNHFHFIGTERLLTEGQFLTFIGLCLNMREPGRGPLMDPSWAGLFLTPMKHLVTLGRGRMGSVYDYDARFATLRIKTGGRKPFLPVVVDVI